MKLSYIYGEIEVDFHLDNLGGRLQVTKKYKSSSIYKKLSCLTLTNLRLSSIYKKIEVVFRLHTN